MLILLPVALFWRGLFWPVAASLILLSYFYAVVHPWLPGRDGLAKSIPLTAIALAGLLLYTALAGWLPPARLFNRAVGLIGLSVFTAAPGDGLLKVIHELEHHEISAMPVVAGGEVPGMVCSDLLVRRSLLRLLQSQAE
ncbi:MAG: hypothetical protein HY784_02600 [Chloroflexi bacterium]|nr:hypothetical protein [Chloroflexota bacterium]